MDKRPKGRPCGAAPRNVDNATSGFDVSRIANPSDNGESDALTRHNRRVVAWKDAQDFTAYRVDKAAFLRNTMLLLGFTADKYTGQVTATIEYLTAKSRRMGHGVRPVSRDALKRHIRTLEALGLVRVWHTGRKTANTYVLVFSQVTGPNDPVGVFSQVRAQSAPTSAPTSAPKETPRFPRSEYEVTQHTRDTTDTTTNTGGLTGTGSGADLAEENLSEEEDQDRPPEGLTEAGRRAWHYMLNGIRQIEQAKLATVTGIKLATDDDINSATVTAINTHRDPLGVVPDHAEHDDAGSPWAAITMAEESTGVVGLAVSA